MDLLPYVFLVGVVLMCGGIAVLADDVGRRLGKKRLHVRGLRPKRVAQIGTFGAGILVSFVTIAVVAFLSSDVRQWIREGNRAIIKVRALDSELSVTKQRLDEAKGQETRLSAVNKRLSSDSIQARRQLQGEKDEETRLSERMSGIRARLANLQSRFASANHRIETLNGEVQRRKETLTAVEAVLGKTTRDLHSVNEQLKASTASVAVVRVGLATAIDQKHQADRDNMALMQEKDRLTAQKATLEKASADARAQYAIVSNELDSASRELDKARGDLTQARTELSETRTELASAMSNSDVWQYRALLPRVARPIYLRGDEVARLPVDPGLSFARAEAQVTTLIRMARVAATKAGAAAHGSQPEALVVAHGDLSADDLERQTSESIAGARVPMVLIATSSINAFKGESVSIEIVSMPNPLVFPRNTLVAKADVDGRDELDAIFKSLSQLGERVRERAEHDQMIPHVGSPEIYGSVSSEEVIHLVNEVKAANRAVEVRAFADADTRAADPLRLRFSVR